MTKILVTGSNGQLGRALRRICKDNTIFLDQSDLDITNQEAVGEAFKEHRPSVVINAAAYTNVDKAEQDHDTAFLVNEVGSKNLATSSKLYDATYIYPSTDYVFDGTASSPYHPTSRTNPKSIYGLSKLNGEKVAQLAPKHFIVRTSWVYGDGNNFVRTMMKLANDLPQISIVDDQLGIPTSAQDLAEFCLFLATKISQYGVYHFCNAGEPITWADFAEEIFTLSEQDCKVLRVTTEGYYAGKDMENIATRPKYSVLDCTSSDNLGFTRRHWKKALEQYISEQ